MKIKASGISPRNNAQKKLAKEFEARRPLILAYGSAGSGKTFMSVGLALDALRDPLYDRDKIVLIRPNVPTGRTLGYRPGDEQEKMGGWVAPMIEIMEEAIGKGMVKHLLASGTLKMQPIESIRGHSYENATILVDEAQNLTWEEIKAITTRIGENSTMIMSGDPTQSDLGSHSSLDRFAHFCKTYEIDAGVVKFPPTEILRSGIVAQLVHAFEYDRKTKQ